METKSVNEAEKSNLVCDIFIQIFAWFIIVGFFIPVSSLRGVEWVHGLFLFPLVLGKM